MKPICKALDVLQGDTYVSLGYLLPTINAIHKALNDLKDLVYCKPLVIALKRGLNHRCYIFVLYIKMFILLL